MLLHVSCACSDGNNAWEQVLGLQKLTRSANARASMQEVTPCVANVLPCACDVLQDPSLDFTQRSQHLARAAACMLR